MTATAHYDPYDPGFTARYWDELDRFREECPVAKNDTFGGIWTFARYEDVARVLQDWRAFTSTTGSSLPHMRAGVLPNESDPPLHTAYRRLLNPFFSPPVIAARENEIQAIIGGALDSFIEDGECDLVDQFTNVYPGLVFFRIVLGIDDEEELEYFHHWNHVIARQPYGTEAWLEAWQKSEEGVRALVERRRNEPPRDDVVQVVMTGEIEGRPLTDDEVTNLIKLLIGAALETTGTATANGLAQIAQSSTLQQNLRDHLDLLPRAVEEFLRFEATTTTISRSVTNDLDFEGQHLRAGDHLCVLLAAANRDPREFEDPTEIDIERERNRHLTFGLGPHRCLGSTFARLQMKVAFEQVLTRMHDLRITEGKTMEYISAPVWGPTYLPVSFTPGHRLDDAIATTV